MVSCSYAQNKTQMNHFQRISRLVVANGYFEHNKFNSAWQAEGEKMMNKFEFQLAVQIGYLRTVSILMLLYRLRQHISCSTVSACEH